MTYFDFNELRYLISILIFKNNENSVILADYLATNCKSERAHDLI